MGDEERYKYHRLCVVLSPEHRLALKRIAKADGESLSVVVRTLIRLEAKARGLWLPKEG